MEIKTTELSILDIVLNTFQICFKNFFDFLKFFAYPVLGQFFGIIFALLPSFVFKISDMEPSVTNFVLILLLTTPGLVLFCHAFWKYLVKSASSNTIALRLIKGEKVENFSALDEVITKKTGSFIGLLSLQLLVSIVMFVVIVFPILLFATRNPLIILTAILLIFVLSLVCLYAIYHISLSTTAFAINENMGAIEAFKKSITLTRNKIFKTFVLLFSISVVLSAFSALFYIPFIGFVFIPVYFILSPPIASLALTHWYLRLEQEQANLTV